MEENFDYEEVWDKQEEKERKKLVDQLPKGAPRKGIKGKHLKIKDYVSKRRIARSYQNLWRMKKNDS